MRIVWPAWHGIRMVNASSPVAREASSTSVWVSFTAHTPAVLSATGSELHIHAFTSHPLTSTHFIEVQWQSVSGSPARLSDIDTLMTWSTNNLSCFSFSWFQCWNAACLLRNKEESWNNKVMIKLWFWVKTNLSEKKELCIKKLSANDVILTLSKGPTRQSNIDLTWYVILIV